MKKNKIILIFAFIAILFFSCTSVEIPEPKVIVLEQFWTDSDCENSVDSLIVDFIKSNEMINYNSKLKPRIVVGRFENMTKEEINTELIEKNVERSLINSGVVTFIASKSKREEVRYDRKNSKDFADSKEIQKFFKTLKADYFVEGKIELKIDSLQITSAKEYSLFIDILKTKNTKSIFSQNIKVIK